MIFMATLRSCLPKSTMLPHHSLRAHHQVDFPWESNNGPLYETRRTTVVCVTWTWTMAEPESNIHAFFTSFTLNSIPLPQPDPPDIQSNSLPQTRDDNLLSPLSSPCLAPPKIHLPRTPKNDKIPKKPQKINSIRVYATRINSNQANWFFTKHYLRMLSSGPVWGDVKTRCDNHWAIWTLFVGWQDRLFWGYMVDFGFGALVWYFFSCSF